MADNRMRKTDLLTWLESRKRMILTIGVPALILIILLVVVIVVVTGKNKGGKDDGDLTPTPTAAATSTPAPVLLDNTPTTAPTLTPTVAPTPTLTPAATPTLTPLPTTTPVPATPTPLPTVTPTPPATGNLSAEQAYRVLCGYSKEVLNIDKEVTEYDHSYDSVTTFIDGKDCYRFTLTEFVNGRDRNRGDFYISVDGKNCYVQDVETGTFVPLPRG